MEALTAIFSEDLELLDQSNDVRFNIRLPFHSSSSAANMWSCPRCTLVNPIEIIFCAACATQISSSSSSSSFSTSASHVILHCLLSSKYPQAEPAAITITSPGLEQAELRKLSSEIKAICEESQRNNEECVFAATTHVQEFISSHSPTLAIPAVTSPSSTSTCSSTSSTSSTSPTSPTPAIAALVLAPAASRISRVFFWTHHTRRKQVLLFQWATELGITGRLTVSKPGYCLVEGETWGPIGNKSKSRGKRTWRDPW